MAAQQKNGPASPGWNPWPYCIVAFFAAAILGCVTFVVYCHRNSTELVALDYYEQEVRYQAQMDRVRQASAFGVRASIVHLAPAKRIVISLPPEHAAAKATGSITLYRPSSAKLDRTYTLGVSPEGFQSIDTEELQSGLWKVRVLWKVGLTEYYLDKEVNIAS